MNNPNDFKPEQGKEANRPVGGDGGKEKGESKPTKLSLNEIMSMPEKLASNKARADLSNSRIDSQSDRQAAAANKKVDQQAGHSNFEALFGMSIVKELDKELTSNKAREFTWMAAKSNFLELPKQFGRKFLQLRKAEIKKPEMIKEDSEAAKWNYLKAAKKEDELTQPKPDLKEKPKEQPPDDETKNKEDEIAIALQVEKIYDEKDYVEDIENATKLSLGIDDAHMQGVQVFKNLEQIRPQDMSATNSNVTYGHLSKKRLAQCIKSLKGGKVIVIGDLLIDELLEGKPERISREAPVLILEHVDTELICGGAANAAHNIAALDGICHAVGVCGKDENAQKLAHLLDAHNIAHSLVQDASRPTTVKTRILSKAHAIKQQLLRLDRISHATINSAIESLLASRLESIAAQFSAIILSDYRAGVISHGVIAACQKIASRLNLPLIVDAQGGFERFQNASLLTPNQPDAQNAVGFSFDTPERLKQGGEDLLLLTGAKAILITRGPDGMVLFRKKQEPFYLPAFNRSDVFDVSGAGDTVVATMTLAMVTGSSMEEAMALGNLAAGIVVRKSGTAVTSQEELLDNLERAPLDE